MQMLSVFLRYVLLFLPFLLAGCAMFSGGVPIPVTANDRELIKSAQAFVDGDVPFITHELNHQPNKIFKVAFDGTLNDRARVPVPEKETVVASIARRIDARYFPGPGMQNPHFVNFVDAAFGYSSASVARSASEAFFKQANAWLDADPHTEVRVFVTGFSRGAAIARHFMNLVARDWDKNTRGRAPAPRFYAILFDTVSTGQMDRLMLSLPTSVEYLVHFIAKDEPRYLFAPVIDQEVESNPDMVTRTFNMRGFAPPKRINLIQLPGAHSDVGSVYDQGIAVLYRTLSEQLIYKMGLLDQSCWENSEEFYTAGKHDSRGVIDRVLGTPVANSDSSKPRNYLLVPYFALDFRKAAESADRLGSMSEGNFERRVGMARIGNTTEYPAFEVLRSGNDLKILKFAPAGFIDEASLEFTVKDGQRRLTYRFLPPYALNGSSLIISDPIWKLLPDGRPAWITYSVIRRLDGRDLVAYVNDVEAVSGRINEEESLPSGESLYKCPLDSHGNQVTPIKSFVVPAGGG